MGPPAPVDLQIALRDAFVFETGLFQQPARGDVLGQASGLDAADVQTGEGVVHRRLYRFAHIAAAGELFAGPIPQGARLCRAAADIIQRDRPDQHVILAADQEQRQRRPRRDRPVGPVDPIGKRFARQVVRCPGRLPRGEVGDAVRPQGGPGAEVSMHRWPQRQPFGFNGKLSFQQLHQAARRSCSSSNVGAPSTGP